MTYGISNNNYNYGMYGNQMMGTPPYINGAPNQSMYNTMQGSVYGMPTYYNGPIGNVNDHTAEKAATGVGIAATVLAAGTYLLSKGKVKSPAAKGLFKKVTDKVKGMVKKGPKDSPVSNPVTSSTVKSTAPGTTLLQPGNDIAADIGNNINVRRRLKFKPGQKTSRQSKQTADNPTTGNPTSNPTTGSSVNGNSEPKGLVLHNPAEKSLTVKTNPFNQEATKKSIKTTSSTPKLLPKGNIQKTPHEVLGVPKNATPYQILGIPENASKKEVINAFRKLAKEHHPDKGKESEEVFKIITKARDLLMPKSELGAYHL